MCLFIHMLMLLDIAITGGVNLRPNFSPGVLELVRLLTNTQKAMTGANINQAEEIEDQTQAKSILLPSDLSRQSHSLQAPPTL